MWRFVIPIGVFVVLAAFFVVGLRLDPSEVPSPLIDKPAPSFSLPGLRDPTRTIGTQTMAGQVVLFNVWGTWCVGCRQEHALLVDIARSGVVPIYGLNWKDDRTAALEWLERLGDPYVESAFDPDGRVAIDWGVYGAPETFLVDADGVVRYKYIGPLNRKVWEEELKPRVLALQGRS